MVVRGKELRRRLGRELLEVPDEMRLIVVAAVHGDSGPIFAGLQGREYVLESKDAAEKLWRKSHVVLKFTFQLAAIYAQ